MDATSEPSADPRRKGSLGVIFLTVFLDLVGFSVIFPLFPAMLEWYLPREGDSSLIGQLIAFLERASPGGGDNTFLTAVLFGGILGSLYSLLQFVAAPIWGRLSDRHGRRNVLLITVGGTFIGYLAWIVSGSFAVLLVSRVIGGIMAGNIAVATAAVADVTSRENRTKGMGLIGMAFGLGFIVGPAIGGLASIWNPLEHFSDADTWGLNPFSFPAACAALLALANWIWVARAFPETRAKVDDKSVEGRRSWFSFIGLQHPHVRSATRIYFVFIFAFSAMEFTLTFLAAERLYYNPRQMTFIFLFVGFVLAFTQGYAVRKYGRRIGEINLVLAGTLAGVLGLCCLGAARDSALFYAGLALMGLGIGLGSPALSSLVSLYSPDDRQGEYLGAFRAAGSLARAFGPLAGATAFWSLGSMNAYFIGAGILLVPFFLGLVLPRPSADEHAPLRR